MPERDERLERALRDNQARRVVPALPGGVARSSEQVEHLERLVAEQRENFTSQVSRRRWTVDLREEALATLRRHAVIAEPVVLIGLEPHAFFALALPDAGFLQQPEALVDDVGYFAVVAESGAGLLIFEWYWNAPPEGQWGELATWGSFRTPTPPEDDWFEVWPRCEAFLARLREHARVWPDLRATVREGTGGWFRDDFVITYADVDDVDVHAVARSYRVDFDGQRALAAEVESEQVDLGNLFKPDEIYPDGDDPVEIAHGTPEECADAAAAWYLEQLSR
ncbi:hypothetical protein OJ997_03735 [Solirubrobacter phytolaccae]|uniref:Uncharacterized protein n=1 Tax=Solirubrobacter phytolaccae TaxID=1404360 RepID=A0A9X3N841_9ACTN|nr:hypothetical protein [Solirubrobacter phytolaccae]MDA0179396.1 hypothetical protein [Solirubrobacter phytolaccae]